jgi:hypothetical protein
MVLLEQIQFYNFEVEVDN